MLFKNVQDFMSQKYPEEAVNIHLQMDSPLSATSSSPFDYSLFRQYALCSGPSIKLEPYFFREKREKERRRQVSLSASGDSFERVLELAKQLEDVQVVTPQTGGVSEKKKKSKRSAAKPAIATSRDAGKSIEGPGSEEEHSSALSYPEETTKIEEEAHQIEQALRREHNLYI